jgi:hypothetical protein
MLQPGREEEAEVGDGIVCCAVRSVKVACAGAVLHSTQSQMATKLLLLIAPVAALVLPSGGRAALPVRKLCSSPMMQFATPPDRTDEEIFPKDKDGKTLITWASLDQTGKDMINMALAQRNKERVLAGESKYEDVDAMIDAYVEFEGEQKSMSRQECEDAVLRFLQRRALLSEGGADLSDPQTIVTFALLGVIVVGALFNLATGNVDFSGGQ